MVISGIANGTCNDCAKMDVTWNLTMDVINPPFCHWHSTNNVNLACLNGGLVNVTLKCNAALQRWELAFDNATPGNCPNHVLYTASAFTWNCLGTNTLTLTGATDPCCTGWPATVTVVPA